MARLNYGVDCAVTYDPTNVDHRAHSHRIYRSPSGFDRILGAYEVILQKVRLQHSAFPTLTSRFKGTLVSTTQEYRQTFCQEVNHPRGNDFVSTEIIAYVGTAAVPKWTVTEPSEPVYHLHSNHA
jgi:hypothetical protein